LQHDFIRASGVAVLLPKEEKNVCSLANIWNPRFPLCLCSMRIFVAGLNCNQDSFSVRPRRERSFFLGSFVSLGSIGLISEGPTGVV
jgi:hypothetical protein